MHILHNLSDIAKVKYLIIIVAMVLTSFAFAEEKKPPVVHVQILDENIDASKLTVSGIQVHQNDEVSTNFLSVERREKIFKSADLLNYVSAWDDVNKDLLIEKAKSYSMEQLASSYKKIPVENLIKLKKLLSERVER